MIDNLKIHYTQENVHYTLEIDTDFDNNNLPYDIASAMIRVIKDSNANYNIVINELKNHFNED